MPDVPAELMSEATVAFRITATLRTNVLSNSLKRETSVLQWEERSSDSWRSSADYVLMCLRFRRRALALAGRFPWLAFLSFRCVLAILMIPVEMRPCREVQQI